MENNNKLIDDAYANQEINNNNDRNIIAKLEGKFQDLIENFKNDETSYNSLSEILDFFSKKTESLFLDNELINDAIFIMGPTGSGKSTLLNYLLYGDESFVLSENKKDIQLLPKIESEIKIGNGKGSTTLFPNVKEILDLFNFIDFAGDCDTDGTLVKLINSFIKHKISNHVKTFKILFVSQQDSLGNTGQYGMALKTSMNDNSNFLNCSIHEFKENIGLIITKADSNENVNKECIELLENVHNHKDCVVNHKLIIESILKNNRFSTFSETSDKQSNIYSPPIHNPNQKNKIIKFINDIKFISNVNFFKISIPEEILVPMKKVFDIVLNKTFVTINKLVKNCTSPITIYSVEILPFLNFIKQLLFGYETDLLNFLKILVINNWFKINKSPELMKLLIDLNKQLNNFYQLINSVENSTNETYYKCDWVSNSNIKNYLETISNKLRDVNKGNCFENFISNEQLQVIPCTQDLSNEFNQLYKIYKDENTMELLKNQNTSKYYFDKKTPIYGSESYVEKENKTRDVPKVVQYTETKTEPVQVTKYRQVKHRTKVGPFNGHPKYSTEQYEDVEYRDVEVKIDKTVVVKENYTENVTKYRSIVTGYNSFREFNESEYQKDKTNIDKEKNMKRSIITNKLSTFKTEKSHSFEVAAISNKDDIEAKYEDLKKLWQNVEYSVYASNNPNNKLELEYDIKSI